MGKLARNYPSQITDDVFNIFSTAGWSKSTQDLTQWMYQNGQTINHLDSNRGMYSQPQVWNCAKPAGQACSKDWATSARLATSATTVAKTYQIMAWVDREVCKCGDQNTVVRDHVNFINIAYDSNGNQIGFDEEPYYMNTYGDPSTHFTAGITSWTNGGTTYTLYLQQNGVESINSQTANWMVQQYNMGSVDLYDYGGLLTILPTNEAPSYSRLGSTSYITHSSSAAVVIGGGDYIAQAHSQLNQNTGGIPAGQVQWYPVSSGGIASGTQLWNPAAVQDPLTVEAVDINSGTAISGLAVSIYNSANQLVASGYTPLTYTVTSSGTYNVIFDNYNHYYFTSTNTTSNYYVANWGGGQVTVTLTAGTNQYLYGFYFNDQNPGNYAKITYQAQDTNGNAISGLYGGFKEASSGLALTQGYTPYTVGVPINDNLNVIWNNYGTHVWQYATPAPTNFQTSSQQTSWGGQQGIDITSTGTYTDTGVFTP
jgi:hypothetical protein